MLEYSILVILQCTCITASLPRLTINGEWSPWSKIKSECVRLNETDHVIQSGITCGGGVRFLERSCTNPKPQVSIRVYELKNIYCECQFNKYNIGHIVCVLCVLGNKAKRMRRKINQEVSLC